MPERSTPELGALRARVMRREDALMRSYWREKAGRHATDWILAAMLVGMAAAVAFGWRP